MPDYARHGELVDAKFLRGLTPAEEAELADLGREMDADTAPFYRPVIARLEAAIREAKGQRDG